MNIVTKYLFERKLKLLKREVVASNFESAKTALILFNADENQTIKEVDAFLRFLVSKNIKTLALGYYHKKNEAIILKIGINYLYFNKKEVNLLGMPTQDEIKELMEIDYDLLFDFNEKNVFPLRYISSLSKAKFKVGWTNSYQEDICDLTFQLKRNTIKNLIEQVNHYLPMIQVNK